MDRRTELLIDALSRPAAAFVFHLLRAGPMSEDQLLELVPESSQSTANRRLQRLGDLGLLIRAPGSRQSKDRPWMVVAPEPAEAFVQTAMALTQAIDQLDAKQRELAEAQLKEARESRHLRAA